MILKGNEFLGVGKTNVDNRIPNFMVLEKLSDAETGLCDQMKKLLLICCLRSDLQKNS